MKKIAIGDKVRVIRGSEEGHVASINKNIVEIEIEDGFTIPVVDKDLVVISSAEQDHFGASDNSTTTSLSDESTGSTLSMVTGHIYAAFTKNQQSAGYQLSIVNHTSFPVFFSTYQKKKESWLLLASAYLESLTYHSIEKILADQDDILICTHQVKDSSTTLPETINNSFRIKPSWFTKEKSVIPLLREQGYFFNLLESKPSKIDVNELKEAMFEKESEVQEVARPDAPEIVDLHIEALVDDVSTINKNEILEYQLKVFEEQFDNAIRAGRHDVTMVHGVGNGTLKYNIQKRLSGHPHVAFYKDAQKEKFGYGAIHIKIK
ncbi:MAG: Smr/MutS family protein [Bacteroidota bacterium]